MFFHVFSVPISGLVFNRIFDGKRYQNDLQNRSPGRPFRPKSLQKVSTPYVGECPRADLFSGIDFSMFSGTLSAPFWARFGPFGSILALIGSMLGPFGSILGAFWTLLADFCKNYIEFGIDLRRWFFHKEFGRKPTNEHTHVPQSNKPINGGEIPFFDNLKCPQGPVVAVV